MNITYDYYRIFYYVAKYHSFTQAANVLFSSQPNVTRAIKKLENELGCTLFVRSNKGVELTPEGEKLFSRISVAFEYIQAAEEELLLEKSLQSGLVTISVTEIALHCHVLKILKDFHKKYPGVHIRLTNHSTPKALEYVKSAKETISSGLTSDMAGLDLEAALSELSEFDGRRVTEDIVDGIFHRFCVGK